MLGRRRNKVGICEFYHMRERFVPARSRQVSATFRSLLESSDTTVNKPAACTLRVSRCRLQYHGKIEAFRDCGHRRTRAFGFTFVRGGHSIRVFQILSPAAGATARIGINEVATAAFPVAPSDSGQRLANTSRGRPDQVSTRFSGKARSCRIFCAYAACGKSHTDRYSCLSGIDV